jgi:hypothetical protein
MDVMAYGIFRKITTLEFFQHHFTKWGHGDGLLPRNFLEEGSSLG